MPDTFHHHRRVEFRDTDAAGILHFANYFGYMEQAEHELLRHRGLSVMLTDEEGPISFPRVSAHCDYRDAARFDDELDIEVGIERVGEKSITFVFTMRRDERVIAEGKIVTVCCRLFDDRPPQSIAIPGWIRSRLEGTDSE